MSVSYDYYRIFYFVGKYGSFTQAAKILLNNQPNITRAMNNLEGELGCQLFFRSRKGVTLTPAGEKLFVHVESAYRQLLLGEAEITSQQNLQSGNVSVAISEIALHGCMLPVLQQYQQAYPGIHIEILNHSSTQAVEALRRGIVDFAVVSSPTDISKPLREETVRSFQEILIAGKRFAALSGKKRSLRDLSAYPLICLSRETKTYVHFNRLFAEHHLLLNPAIEAATTDQVLPMVLYGIGIGFVPAELAAEALRRKEVFQVHLKEKIPDRRICLVRDMSRPLSVAASVLHDFVLQNAA